MTTTARTNSGSGVAGTSACTMTSSCPCPAEVKPLRARARGARGEVPADRAQRGQSYESSCCGARLRTPGRTTAQRFLDGVLRRGDTLGRRRGRGSRPTATRGEWRCAKRFRLWRSAWGGRSRGLTGGRTGNISPRCKPCSPKSPVSSNDSVPSWLWRSPPSSWCSRCVQDERSGDSNNSITSHQVVPSEVDACAVCDVDRVPPRSDLSWRVGSSGSRVRSPAERLPSRPERVTTQRVGARR